MLAVSLLVLSATSLSAVDRGLGNPKSVYIPKGTVAFSLSGGYDQWKATGEDLEQGIILAGLIDEVNGHVNLTTAAAGVSWFFADNLSIGLRFAYDNKDIDVNHLELLSLVRLDIKYRNDRTPTFLTIVTSSSYLGDYFTGGSGSVAYFDEFRFLYY